MSFKNENLSAQLYLLYAFFWVIPRRLNFICRRFGTLCSIFLPTKMEKTECSETSAYKIQTPGNHPEETIQHSGHGKSLKSRTTTFYSKTLFYYPFFII